MTAPVPLPTHAYEDVAKFLRALWRFNRAIGQEFEPLLHERHGTDPRSFFILKSIQGGVQYPKELAGHLKIPATLLSRYLDDLRRRGLIERHIDEQDSRRTRLSLTDAGTALVEATQHTVHEAVGARLARLRPEQLDALVSALLALTDEGSPA
ncbi:MarR family winged helix-turn-helix transcriptional regulator [Deinococcus pimensis]|uniref:MarR family winged helix-turn-helix transcriptional regulator n=1 Tax=Deinococcus pimensis TaxID=309888 RepID=UPI000486C31F|nr:MarR family winged helix-turn-helix transcriptional regulator [Deinococcus pimensis]